MWNRKLFLAACASGMLFSGTAVFAADNAPVPPPAKGEMRGGPGGGMRNPDMPILRAVEKELKAYNAGKTPENLAALQTAIKKAFAADTARTKAALESRLANLATTQAARETALLEKAKNGTLEFAPAPDRGYNKEARAKRAAKGKRANKRGSGDKE